MKHFHAVQAAAVRAIRHTTNIYNSAITATVLLLILISTAFAAGKLPTDAGGNAITVFAPYSSIAIVIPKVNGTAHKLAIALDAAILQYTFQCSVTGIYRFNSQTTTHVMTGDTIYGPFANTPKLRYLNVSSAIGTISTCKLRVQ